MSKIVLSKVSNLSLFALTKINFWVFFFLLPLLLTLGEWFISSIYVLLLTFIFILDNITEIKLFDKLVMFLFLLTGIFAYLNTPLQEDKFPYLFATVVTPFLIFIIFSNVELDGKKISKFVDFVIASGLVLSFAAFYQVSVLSSFEHRLPSLWTEVNIVAAYYMIVFFFCLIKIIYEEYVFKKIIYIACLFIVFFGLFLTQTRGIWIATVCGIIFYIIRKPKVLLPVLIVIGFFTLLFLGIIIERYLTIKNFTSDASSIGRLHAWYISLLIIKDNWFWGSGFNSFLYLRDSVVSVLLIPVTHSHNTYLRLWVETGILGLFSTLYFLIRSFYFTFVLRKYYHYSREHIMLIDAMQLSFVGLFIGFMFDTYLSTIGDTLKIIWILIGISYNIYYSKTRID